MSSLSTICVLVNAKGEKLECQPVDARDHMKNGWKLIEKPDYAAVTPIEAAEIEEDESDEKPAAVVNKNTPQRNKGSGEASVVSTVKSDEK